MKIPEMMNVSSSNVMAIGYDSERQEAFVRFLNGSLYVYYGVPAVAFDGLRAAQSIGSYLHRNFKNVYAYERIE